MKNKYLQKAITDLAIQLYLLLTGVLGAITFLGSGLAMKFSLENDTILFKYLLILCLIWASMTIAFLSFGRRIAKSIYSQDRINAESEYLEKLEQGQIEKMRKNSLSRLLQNFSKN
jgi:hypothetical protein